MSRFTHDGCQGSIAAFTDIFRLRMLAREPGWWFDTDVFCLKDAADFAALEARSPGLLLGFEEADKVNNAVLYFSDPAVAADLLDRAEARAAKRRDVLEWGALGPSLVTEYLKEVPARVLAVPESHFYPIHYLETARLFSPDDADHCRQRASAAVCVHLWNEFLRRWNVPKNILPCEGSFLHQLFAAQGMTVAPDATLPPGAFEALRHNGEIGRVGGHALRLIKEAKRIKEAVVGR